MTIRPPAHRGRVVNGLAKPELLAIPTWSAVDAARVEKCAALCRASHVSVLHELHEVMQLHKIQYAPARVIPAPV